VFVKLAVLGVVLGCVLVFWRRLSGLVDTAVGLLDNLFERRRTGPLKDAPLAGFLLAPALAVLGVFGVAPLVLAVYLSLFEGKGLNMRFGGLVNYSRALSQEGFWDSFLVTVYYAAGTIPLCLIVSFLVANGLYRLGRGRGLFRTLYFLPYVTSVVAAATVWRVILHPHVGLVNAMLQSWGFSADALPQWLLEPNGAIHLLTGGVVSEDVGPSLALCCVILFDVWHASGFMIVILLAGLTTIPRELEEAATIDGAGPLQRAWHVTLPLISPTVFFLLIVSVIKGFQAFNSFYALTGNGRGPLDTTQNMTVYIFTNLYEYQRLGYGAAAATLLAVAIVILTLLQWRFVGRRVHYE